MLVSTEWLKNNISKDSEIVCYCMHGHRASSLFIRATTRTIMYPFAYILNATSHDGRNL
jgi:3-mercaptopyruvate sulfurtransferase SseA